MLHTLEVPGGYFRGGLVFSPDGEILAVGYQDGTIRLWDVETGQVLRTLAGHTDRMTTVAFSPDGALLVSGAEDKGVRLWDIQTGHLLHTLDTSSANRVFFSADGTMLVLSLSGGTVRLWGVPPAN